MKTLPFLLAVCLALNACETVGVAGKEIDPRLVAAADYADQHNASKRRTKKPLCWRGVKKALLATGAVSSRPKTENAIDAGDELMRTYGFIKLSINDPTKAPIGAVIVYSSGPQGFHVEIRTRYGFASDYKAKNHYAGKVSGIYIKTRSNS